MQTNNAETQEQQKTKKIQEKIKLMMKYKKMQKLASDKDLISEKPLSTINDKNSLKFDQISVKNNKIVQLQHHYFNSKAQEYLETYSSKRIKSNNQADDLIQAGNFHLKDSNKKLIMMSKQRKEHCQINILKKVPSAEKIQFNEQINNEPIKKTKRPSSVFNKSTRTAASRTNRQKALEPQEQKQMQQKIRSMIRKCFQMGIKLQKYAVQKSLDLNKQYELLMSEQINILKLINNSRKHYVLRTVNEEEHDNKLSIQVEKQIIQLLKKKKDKLSAISKCDQITHQISKLIDSRLSILNQTKASI